jgi:DNA polymerase III epsilon subunit-like protein
MLSEKNEDTTNTTNTNNTNNNKIDTLPESASPSESPSPLKFLEGKNIFVFDTETTGLPERCPNGWGSYWSYFMNEKYENSRIISIAWATIHNFHKDKINTSTTSTTTTTSTTSNTSSEPSTTPIPQTIVEHYLRYPEGFTEINNSHIHGITYEDAINNGLLFKDILENKSLCVDILKSEYIIAHNINFDYHVLMNELYRLGTEYAKACMLHLNTLKAKGRLICTGELTTDICKMEFKTVSTYKGNKKTKRYKMPKLSELYVYYYGKEFENQHSADGDVKALLEIISKI